MDDNAPKLTGLESRLLTLREEAVRGRKDSGIEDVWLAAENAYAGIDSVNEGAGRTWAKPTSMQGPLTREGGKNDDRSTIFIPLTARYVDAGHAKVCEMLLPIDDKPFSFDPTPVPELVDAREQLRSIMSGKVPAANVQPPNLEELQVKVQSATDKAKRAEQQVDDWFVETQLTNKMRTIMFDAARVGTGIAKGPVSQVSKGMAVLADGAGGVRVEISEKVVPGVDVVSCWNLYPDPACGDNINNGDYLWEYDELTRRRIEALKTLPYYNAAAINMVLAEGPGATALSDDGDPAKKASGQTAKEKNFPVWYFYGIISPDEALEASCHGLTDGDRNSAKIFVIATMINDRVVRVVKHLLLTAKFPHRVFPWRRRAGHWAGVGVGEQCDAGQRIVNAASRAMLTNGGQSAGVQLIVDNTAVIPTNKEWKITPNKTWTRAPNSNIDDMRKAFHAVEIPDRQASLQNIINYGFRLAEESTNIPLISQGQSGPTTPDTYGGQSLQNNNANQLLRNIAATADDCLTEPLVTDFYEWLLLDPDIPADIKGDFKINAHGSVALVERALQDQVIQNLVAPALNPAYELNPAKVMREYLKSKRIDPRSLGYTDEEKQQLANQPPPEAPVVTAAKLRNEGMLAVAKLRKETDTERIRRDTDRDTVYVMAQTARDKAEFTSRREELMIRRELALVDYANRKQISLDLVRSQLAKTAMTLRTQKELATARAAAPQVASPAAEPPGRAPNGEAFQK